MMLSEILYINILHMVCFHADSLINHFQGAEELFNAEPLKSQGMNQSNSHASKTDFSTGFQDQRSTGSSNKRTIIKQRRSREHQGSFSHSDPRDRGDRDEDNQDSTMPMASGQQESQEQESDMDLDLLAESESDSD